MKLLKIALVALAVLLAAAYGAFEVSRSRTFQFFGGITARVEADEKVIALTFDDGPTDRTDEILAVLGDADVRATFFLVGQAMEEYPKETARIAAAGHQIANHSWSHRRMVLHTLSFIEDEISRTDSLIRAAGYQGGIQFRPPNGKKLVLLPYYLYRHGRNTIMWDIEPNTYPEVDKSAETIVEHVLQNARPGSIILLHVMCDGKGTSIGAIKGIAKGLKEKGYEFVTVNELLSYNNK